MDDDIADAVADASRQFGGEPSVAETLAAIVAQAQDALPAFAHVGLSVTRARGRIQTDAATSAMVGELDSLQYELGEGPCVDTIRGVDVVIAPGIRGDRRWPRYVPAAAEKGLRAQLALRLHLDRRGTVAGLNLYSTTREEIPERDVHLARVFATHAALALGRARTVDSLNAAMQSRQEIGKALGMLMERFKIDEEAAMAYLWRASSLNNLKVRDIAANMIEQANRHHGGGRRGG